MEHFRQQVEWRNYLSTLLVNAEMLEAEHEAEYKAIEAVHLTGEYEKLWQAKAARDADPEYQQAHRAWLDTKRKRKILTTVIKNREEAANILSRELSRRLGSNRRPEGWTP